MIQLPDLINGLYELGGGFAIWMNVKAIYKAKMVRGVNFWSTLFFTSWGYWNLAYYPSLHQWCSFVGGLGIVVGNTAWIYLAWKYRNA